MSGYLKRVLKSWPGFRSVYRSLDNQFDREEFVAAELRRLPPDSLLLDAGCGSQMYRRHCGHLRYRAQDLGEYVTDHRKMIGTDGVGGASGYQYGTLDYTGNVWDIAEADGAFDAVLCTEVLEHIPYPILAIREFSRLLRPGGTLILTAPGNSLRHMDPFYYYGGFSDRWFERVLPESGFVIETLLPVGDYYRWMSVELARTAVSHSFLAKIALAPAFLYYWRRPKTEVSVDTLCLGYLVVARRS